MRSNVTEMIIKIGYRSIHLRHVFWAATGVADAVRLRQVTTLRPKRCISISIMPRGLILCHEGTRFRDRTCREPRHITPAALPR